MFLCRPVEMVSRRKLLWLLIRCLNPIFWRSLKKKKFVFNAGPRENQISVFDCQKNYNHKNRKLSFWPTEIYLDCSIFSPVFAASSALPPKLVLSAASSTKTDLFYLKLGDLKKQKTMLSHLAGRVVTNISEVSKVSVSFCDITKRPIFL